MDSSSTPQGTAPRDSDLAALAEMTGYKTSAATQIQNPAAQAGNSTGDAASNDLLDEDDLTSEAIETETPLWSNPIAKGSFVAVLMAILFGSIGLFLLSVNNRASQSASQPDAQQTVADVPTIDTQQSEIGRLKTVAAIGSQSQTLEQNARTNGARILPQALPTAQSPKAGAPPPPTPVVRSVPTYSSIPARSYSAPAPLRSVTPSAPARSVPPSSYGNSYGGSALRQPVDPQQAWQTAQALGSYGHTSPTPVGSSQTQAQPQDQGQFAAPDLTPIVAPPPGPTATPVGLQSLGTATVSAVGSDDSIRYAADAAALLSGTPSRARQIAAGATAEGELVTPIVWAQDLQAQDQPQKFDIQLSQPLTTPDGTVALPAGTKLVASVGSVSASGLLELQVESAIVSTGSGSRAVSIPAGAIVVSSDGGRPLIAENYRGNRGALLGHDIETTLLGALAEVGTLLNRPTNESTTTSPYLSSTSVTNGNTNIVGGILQGGFGALQTSLQQREQQQVQAILTRPSLWFIKAGQSVQIFVNSSFTLQI